MKWCKSIVLVEVICNYFEDVFMGWWDGKSKNGYLATNEKQTPFCYQVDNDISPLEIVKIWLFKYREWRNIVIHCKQKENLLNHCGE
jgi:hypothetical protein